MTVKEMRDSLRGEQVVKALNSRNMEAFLVGTKEEALKKALELIPEGSSVGWGGSASIEEIGLKETIKNGKYKVVDREEGSSQEEAEKLMRDIFFCDYFLASSNAVSEDGVLVNVDGNSNRVAAICYGPKHVIMIIGMNKVVKSVEDAMSRARNTAAPLNAQRFDIDTPCKKTGCCYDCKKPDTVCCQILITRYSRHVGRIKVILVNEELGF
ncbi:lactate utilization protein [Fusobacterium varium]|uniref:lactate utilization protein n=1 Tax=Fusobacterium varium TaxID=856 RepID=UPI000E4C6065|nr:lactate utilization protein [Fusobacterium varium]RHG35997.1 lactate utilization protein [Fusobacterium varium]